MTSLENPYFDEVAGGVTVGSNRFDYRDTSAETLRRRDELVDVVLELQDLVHEQGERIDDLEERLEDEREERKSALDDAGQDRAAIRRQFTEGLEELDDDLGQTEDRLHRERGKLARRVSALEDELGIAATDALATAEAGEDGEHLTKLGRLIRHGPDAITDQPGRQKTLHRARDLVDNWNDWGTVKDDKLGKERRLASKKHHLLTHLEGSRNEDLSWKQVYRAMEWIGENSGPNVTLTEDSEDEGKYVLVHRLEGDG